MNALTPAQHQAKFQEFHNKIRIRCELDEVVTGRRGFVSHTAKEAKRTGVSQEWVTKMAQARGLTAKIHGSYGLTFQNDKIHH